MLMKVSNDKANEEDLQNIIAIDTFKNLPHK